MKILNPTQPNPTLVGLMLFAIMSIFAPMAGAQDQDDADAEALEEVIVHGIRQSLQAAADAKRNDARIMDALVAEDIGKLPDNNIAEALQRVTGVSINRDFGVGSEVSIRGLSQNRVELNGRSTLGDDRNGIDFQDFPSSFLSAVEVIKSPTPEMIEGALGGTISLKTRRPLDLKERLLAATAEYEYADKTENWAPIVNLFGGDNWDLGEAGQFGVIGRISYQDRSLRQDTYQASLFVYENIDINQDGTVDESDNAKNTPSGAYVVPVEPKYEPWVEDRERTAYDLTAQWAPASGKGSFYLDLNFTERDGGEEAYSILSVGGNPVATADTYEDGNGALNNYRLAGGHLAIPKTWSEFRVTDSFSHAFGGEWDITDQITVSGEYATAESDTSHPKSELNWRAIDRALETATPADLNQRSTPVTIINSSGKPPSAVYDDGEIFTQEDHLALREFRHITDDIENSEEAFRLDVEYTNPINGLDWLTALKGGLRTTEREYERDRAEERIRDIHRNLTTNGAPDIIWMADFKAAHPGTIITPSVGSDIFDHTGTAGTNQLAPFTVYDAKLLRNADATYRRIQQLLEGTNLATTGSLSDNLERQFSSYSLIEEETLALYVQADLDFDHIRFVVGGRYVETDLTSSAYQLGGTEPVLVANEESYSDFLPSLNATVNLTEDTLMRFSAAKVMRRPDFGELSPSYQYNSDRITATQGNVGLEPYRATQFDIALEHYFGDHNLVSATFFYKGVESFLKDTSFCAYQPDALAQQNLSMPSNICIRPGPTGDSSTYVFAETAADFADVTNVAGDVTSTHRGILTETKENGSRGEVEGVELGWVQTFDMLPEPWSGLGINANYIYSDSEDPDGVPLADISENAYNIQLFWEYGDFSVRLAYNWRERFLDNNYQKRVERVGDQVANRDETIGDPTEGNDYRDDQSQMDFAANWDITENISAHMFIYNITAEPTVNQSTTGTTWQIRETDRRFTLGVRASF